MSVLHSGDGPRSSPMRRRRHPHVWSHVWNRRPSVPNCPFLAPVSVLQCHRSEAIRRPNCSADRAPRPRSTGDIRTLAEDPDAVAGKPPTRRCGGGSFTATLQRFGAGQKFGAGQMFGAGLRQPDAQSPSRAVAKYRWDAPLVRLIACGSRPHRGIVLREREVVLFLLHKMQSQQCIEAVEAGQQIVDLVGRNTSGRLG